MSASSESSCKQASMCLGSSRSDAWEGAIEGAREGAHGRRVSREVPTRGQPWHHDEGRLILGVLMLVPRLVARP
eukprot:7377370-Prymnesium_polylepis.2